jgi:hypothetical protein
VQGNSWRHGGNFKRLNPKNPPRTRLSSFFQKFKENEKELSWANVRDPLLDSLKTAEPDQNFDNIDFSLENPAVFDIMAAAAVTLRSDDVSNEPMFAAFRAANLDPKIPHHWRMLMMAFCWSHFPPKGASGGPSLTDDDYAQLLADAAQIREIAAPRKVSDRQMKAKLVKTPRFKARYESISAERVRGVLREARKPEYHKELHRRLYPDLNRAFEKRKSEGLDWIPKHEAAVRKSLNQAPLRPNCRRMD